MELRDIRTVPITDKIFTGKDLDEAYEAGVREVVEWVNEHTYDSGFIWQEGWQAKLREWKLDKEV